VRASSWVSQVSFEPVHPTSPSSDVFPRFAFDGDRRREACINAVQCLLNVLSHYVSMVSTRSCRERLTRCVVCRAGTVRLCKCRYHVPDRMSRAVSRLVRFGALDLGGRSPRITESGERRAKRLGAPIRMERDAAIRVAS